MQEFSHCPSFPFADVNCSQATFYPPPAEYWRSGRYTLKPGLGVDMGEDEAVEVGVGVGVVEVWVDVGVAVGVGVPVATGVAVSVSVGVSVGA